jgi:hypothetical protein
VTAPTSVPAASSAESTPPAGTVALPPSPTTRVPSWLAAVVAAGAVLVVISGVGVFGGRPDPVAALLAAAAAGAAHVAAGVVGRASADRARRRWISELDVTEASCRAQLASRGRSLRHRWPTSADLVERLRRGESPPVVGATALVVLGTGAVASGVALVGDEAAGVAGHPRVEALRRQVETLPDGPLCVDAAGGVHVTGPPLLVESLAGGWQAQLRHRGAPTGLVTWRRATSDPDPEGGAGRASDAACVVEISRRGTVLVVRRGGRACSVPVTPSWTSWLDAPVDPPADPEADRESQA